MNDSSTGPIVIGLLFILRCLIPLGILFGISYLLQRLGLVNDYAEEKKTGLVKEAENQPPEATNSSARTHSSKSATRKKQGKKKAATPNKRSPNQ